MLKMRIHADKLCTYFLLGLISTTGFAQKVKVGYDKSVDFKKFATYSWAQPATLPGSPTLYQTVVASVDHQLQSKGLKQTENDADLILTPAGGVDFGFAGAASTPIAPYAAYNATMWTGAGPSSAATLVTEGTLVLTFVDRINNKTVWSGSVKQKLDVYDKRKSLELADKAVIKLLKQFPSKK
jgi:uncharacterized protein DUF4136